MNVAQAISRTIDACAERDAVVHRDTRWTYAQLGAQADMLRRRIASAGLGEGERVVLWMENGAPFIATYLAVLAQGAVAVPVHAQTPAAEVERLLRQVSATGLVVSDAVARSMRGGLRDVPLRFVMVGERLEGRAYAGRVEPAPPGLATILYTSGSTGQPKGVMLSHRNLTANTRAILSYLQLDAEDSTVALLPFAYSYGHSVLLTHLFAGARIVIENGLAYSGAVLQRMREEQVSGLSGVAATFALLLEQQAGRVRDLRTLRYLTHAGGAMPPALLARLRTRFPEARIFIMYGQTEAAPRLTWLPPEDLDRKPGSVGRAIEGVSLRIVREDGAPAATGETGEVWAMGENVMQGYWGDPAGSAAALKGGWLRTGDIGCLDAEGYLTLVGRNDEIIKSGGYRIGPHEIEAVLREHAAVQDAAVVGVDDAILGEHLCALVIPRGARPPGEKELLAHCARRLAPYKRPRAIRLVEQLPRSPSGKLLREKLREMRSLLAL